MFTNLTTGTINNIFEKSEKSDIPSLTAIKKKVVKKNKHNEDNTTKIKTEDVLFICKAYHNQLVQSNLYWKKEINKQTGNFYLSYADN